MSSKILGCAIYVIEKNFNRYGIQNISTITFPELPQQTQNMDTLNVHKSLPILPHTNWKVRFLIGLYNIAKLCVPVEGRLIDARWKILLVYSQNKSDSPPDENLHHVCTCTKYDEVDNLASLHLYRLSGCSRFGYCIGYNPPSKFANAMPMGQISPDCSIISSPFCYLHSAIDIYAYVCTYIC